MTDNDPRHKKLSVNTGSEHSQFEQAQMPKEMGDENANSGEESDHFRDEDQGTTPTTAPSAPPIYFDSPMPLPASPVKSNPSNPSSTRNNDHNRTMTPHTASLMSLFAKPPSSPQTPSTPLITNAFGGGRKTTFNPLNNPSVPSMPLYSTSLRNGGGIGTLDSPNEMEDLEEEENDDNDEETNESGETKPFLLRPRQKKDQPMSDGANKLSLRRQNTPQIHNRSSESIGSNSPSESPEKTSKSVGQNWPNKSNKNGAGSNDLMQLFQNQEPTISKESNDGKADLLTNGSGGKYSTFSKDDSIAAIIEKGNESNELNSCSFSNSNHLDTKENGKKTSSLVSLPSAAKNPKEFDKHTPKNFMNLLKQLLKSILSIATDPHELKTTLIGAFLFMLYCLVFSFSEASTITRPSQSSNMNDTNTLLAPMARLACVGTFFMAPMLTAVLSGDFPALYPTIDMFMAPFLAEMAIDIDEVLVLIKSAGNADLDGGTGDGAGDAVGAENDDMEVFLATFVALNAFGMLLSGLLCILACKVKLANLAGFLPYPVLCGFFSSVGISCWMSAFKVDTGMTVQKVIFSGDWKFILVNFARHIPSLVVGIALYIFVPKNPAYLVGIITATFVLAYSAMAVTHISLEEAQQLQFFWALEEVTLDMNQFRGWEPFKPFGLWINFRQICWPAFMNGLKSVIALSVIYLLRCSLHAAALKKNLANLKLDHKGASKQSSATESPDINIKSSQGVLLDASSPRPEKDKEHDHDVEKLEEGHNKKKKRKPQGVMEVLGWYANGLISIAFTGGFANLPAFALGGLFSKFGAYGQSPQYLGFLLLFGCYLMDFRIVSYVPKCTFSSLLVLAAVDFIHSWFIKSYYKTAERHEWLVVPFIVVTSLSTGMLASVGMGMALSTLLFVASFFRAGVVKFIANGLTLRSTIERNCDDNQWLDKNADMIQILVLQNYLFFGNASSCLQYISSMFDDDGPVSKDIDLPPIPKYLILDMSIVTGIDTSAVDVLAEISSLCKGHKCQLMFTGIPPSVRSALMIGGVKPSQLNSHLTFTSDLETALGKAEDGLLKSVAHHDEKTIKVGAQLRHKRRISMMDFGLRHALGEIDKQHGISMAKQLEPLEKYTNVIELDAGDMLNGVNGHDKDLQRGLFFIEHGLLKCEHDSSASLTRGRTRYFATPQMMDSTASVGKLRARSATVGRGSALLKSTVGLMSQFETRFRLARVGPGWLIGSIAEFTGQEIPGTYTCMTNCRVHHLSFETIEKLEKERPSLVVDLYKMVAHLMARRQEMTIGQLATLRSIMSSNAPTKPISRKSLAAVNNVMKFRG